MQLQRYRKPKQPATPIIHTQQQLLLQQQTSHRIQALQCNSKRAGRRQVVEALHRQELRKHPVDRAAAERPLRPTLPTHAVHYKTTHAVHYKTNFASHRDVPIPLKQGTRAASPPYV